MESISRPKFYTGETYVQLQGVQSTLMCSWRHLSPGLEVNMHSRSSILPGSLFASLSAKGLGAMGHFQLVLSNKLKRQR